MRDPATFLWTAVAVCMMAAFVTALVRARKDRASAAIAEKKAQQDKDRDDKIKLDAGTHVRAIDGKVKPKCYACNQAASLKPYMWGHNDRFLDLFKRMAGAPPRLQIVRDKKAHEVTCVVHDPLLLEEFRREHAEDQVDKAKLESLWETRRARFQQQGVYELALAKIAKHELELGGKKRKKADSKTNVVPITKVGGV